MSDLIARIEATSGCAPHWANVFQVPDGDRPEDPAQASAYDVKVRRAGLIHPDAAYAIGQILGVDFKEIMRAQKALWLRDK